VAGQVFDVGGVFRRDDEAELVAVVLAAIKEGVAIGAVLGRRIESACWFPPRTEPVRRIISIEN
jgi:hypothetical protein